MDKIDDEITRTLAPFSSAGPSTGFPLLSPRSYVLGSGVSNGEDICHRCYILMCNDMGANRQESFYVILPRSRPCASPSRNPARTNCLIHCICYFTHNIIHTLLSDYYNVERQATDGVLVISQTRERTKFE